MHEYEADEYVPFDTSDVADSRTPKRVRALMPGGVEAAVEPSARTPLMRAPQAAYTPTYSPTRYGTAPAPRAEPEVRGVSSLVFLKSWRNKAVKHCLRNHACLTECFDIPAVCRNGYLMSISAGAAASTLRTT